MKTFLIIVLGLIVLFMGGCGLLFTFGAIIDWDGWNGYSVAMLTVSLPSLVVAALLGWLIAWLRKPAPAKDEQGE